MTEEHADHLKKLIKEFDRLASDKYIKGQIQHGGSLWEKEGLLDMAIDEAIDQVIYLLTLKQQLGGLKLGKRETY